MKLLPVFLILPYVGTSGAASEEHYSRYHRFLEVQDNITPLEVVAYRGPNDPNAEPIFCTMVAAGQGAAKCLPRTQEDHRRLLSNGGRRRSEGLSITRPSKETGLTFSREIVVEVEGVDLTTKNVMIVFTGDNGIVYTFSVTNEDVSEGIALEIVGNLQPGKYAMKLVSSDGDLLIALSEEDKIIVRPEPPGINRVTGGVDSPLADKLYEGGGTVMAAVGRIYFVLEGDLYACSGSVIHDNKIGRSLILTAAHCIWPDAPGQEVFGSNVTFIPNRDSVKIPANKTGRDIHRICTHDICGCWTLSGGVVHDVWADTPWPQRLAYDYGFYVVKDYGMHDGKVCRDTEALDIAVDELDFSSRSVGVDIAGEFGFSFGYSLSFNPFVRYCADNITVEDDVGVETAWLNACTMSDGSSGGPWMVDFDKSTGKGKVISVNSWTKSWAGGTGGPLMDASAAQCLLDAARTVDINAMEAEAVGKQGIFVNCYHGPCIVSPEGMLCKPVTTYHKNHQARGLVADDSRSE
jgi:hypothetical protein